ncbi:MAG TPA: hypothetical protein PKL22_11475 [Saprospiraceae bacterium]|nr:hypothetical protein [Saprospiraceae bacterium]
MLVVIGGILISALIFGAGIFLGHSNFFANNNTTNSFRGQTVNNPSYSMMDEYNMMGGYNTTGSFENNNTTNVPPLTVDQAKQAVEGYLNNLNKSDLELKEIMIFSNNAYARIVEKSTGIGAMELLVDPISLSVYPEYGPNMMWNQKYGQMGGYRMMGGSGMMGGYYNNTTATSSQMTVTSDQALQIAQQYLDKQFPGYKTATDADPFYGYYTIDIMKENQPAGMLSVNGYSGQVFLHTWHGTFIEMWE